MITMTTEVTGLRKAGFWPRFTAIWIDSALVFIGVYVAVVSARVFSIYVPFEASALIAAIVYSTLLIGAKGQTVGKSLCGLRVTKKEGNPVNYLISFLRECFAKPIVALVLPVALAITMARLLGPPKDGLLFFVLPSIVLLITYLIHFAFTKRTWYDYLTRTIVQQEMAANKRGVIPLVFVLSFSALLLLWQTSQYVEYYQHYNDMLPYSTARTPYDVREPQKVVDISTLAVENDARFVGWLDANAKSPIDYAVHVASMHQVVVFGESHGNRGQVSFLAEAIPALYHRAGVRCVAMEVCTYEDNENIARLVTAPEYDHDLALRIARDQPWHSWGAKEYWDVLHTVWRLNKSLPDSEKKMRVVGIDSQWDGPSFALVTPGDDATKAPIWEKLRIIRVLLGSLGLLLRDELMAREVERQIINAGDKGIVWVGANHSFINYKQAYGKGRMAYILRHKYGDKIFQVLLHSKDTSPSVIDASYSGPSPRMGDFIERIMAYRGDTPAGLDIVGSPFEFLRDSTNYYYFKQSNAALGDVASGYIFLEPRKKFVGCRWITGFITPKMFATYRPFYEGRANRTFGTAEETDAFFKKETESME
jgi:uncharacterized RDD family membrane protein YckC